MSFSLCEAKADGSDPSVDCFEKRQSKLMVRHKNNKTFKNYYTISCENKHKLNAKDVYWTLKVRLPKNVTCKHCILRVIFQSGFLSFVIILLYLSLCYSTR